MFKKLVALILALMLSCSLFSSCKKQPQGASSISSNKENSVPVKDTSSQATSGSLIDIKPEQEYVLKRNSFLSVNENGDIFYCGASGGIYKQLADNKGISKIYSGNGYQFFSVDCFEQDKICVGFKSEKLQSSYIIFNLKDKTVENAVLGDEFKDKNIYQLLHHNGVVFFLANPDRYGRCTLYTQTDGVTKTLVSGVNEFFVWGENIFYNIGNAIYALDLKTEPATSELIEEAEYSYLSGFTIVGNTLLYSTELSTYFINLISGGYAKLPNKLNVWTGTRHDAYAFFCGEEGGIYAVNLENGIVSKVSDYTAGGLECIGEHLYLSPANIEDYPDVQKDYIVSDGIYRFLASDLLSQIESEKQESNSSDVTSSSHTPSESISSSPAVEEKEPIKPEKFGR